MIRNHFPPKALVLPAPLDGYQDPQGEAIKSLSGLSTVNLFVGPNNSGKSRFLRTVFSTWGSEITSADGGLERTLNSIMTKLLHIREVVGTELAKTKNIVDRYHAQMTSVPKLEPDYYSRIADGIQKDLGDSPDPKRTERNYIEAQHVKTIAGEVIHALRSLASGMKRPNKYYVPTLRGFRPVGGSYRERTIRDYFTREDGIFTGEDMYSTVRSMLLGELKERKKIRQYEQFLEDRFFNKEIALIPRENSDVLFVKIGNEKEMPIHHLGDGVQSAIILTFMPFMDENGVFFIEEPETHMHPGMQRQLIEFYCTRASSLFLITTHSNHMLELTLDYSKTSVFSLTKHFATEEAQDEISAHYLVRSTAPGDQNLLQLLGVRAASVFLVNATIWVEGISDRWFLRLLLKSYFFTKKLVVREDTHYSFVEYGGANITHWSFLHQEDHPIEVKSLCSRLKLIIDRDSGKEERHEALRHNLKNQLIITPGREVENLLPPKALVGIVSDLSGVPTADFGMPRWEDYKDAPLGEFIDEIMLSEKSPTKWAKFRASSGTVKDKRRFWEVACAHLERLNFHEYPSEVQSMGEEIAEFIRDQN